MNAPPDWQDGECCFRCRTQFTLVARKHHCRNCGNIFCAKCSSQQIPIPKLNIEKNVRVCDTCYEKLDGKNEDPLTLALGSKDNEAKSEQSSKKKSQTSNNSSGNKSGSSASAPSEQDLKEEEELQLALALSLSETPTKVIFPDYRQLEETMNATPKRNSPPSDRAPSKMEDIRATEPSNKTGGHNSNSHYPMTSLESDQTQIGTNGLPAMNSIVNSSHPAAPIVKQQQTASSQPTPSEYQIQEKDQELFRYIMEVHGHLEVFNNRLEACKLRNRPVANDAAIQSLFIKLNSEIQPRLSAYVKTYEEEREVHERLQDKLSQIADARAALDALREEHQDKMRQMAAEAEKQRQSQLATKLEAMRQKKTQMMQYQRELAMQRIREQEMMYLPPQQDQQVTNDYHARTNTGHLPYQQPFTEQESYDLATQSRQVVPNQGQIQSTTPQVAASTPSHQPTQQWQQSHSTQYQQPYVPVSQSSASYTSITHSTQLHGPEPPHFNSFVTQNEQLPATQTQQPAIDRVAIAQLEKQYLPDAKPDEEAPLISFDD